MMKDRICHQLKIYGAVLGILILYYLWVRMTGLALLCPIHAITGLSCPGCGITRLFMALAEGDFTQAYASNQAIFWLAPLALADFFGFTISISAMGKKRAGFIPYPCLLCW